MFLHRGLKAMHRPYQDYPYSCSFVSIRGYILIRIWQHNAAMPTSRPIAATAKARIKKETK